MFPIPRLLGTRWLCLEHRGHFHRRQHTINAGGLHSHWSQDPGGGGCSLGSWGSRLHKGQFPAGSPHKSPLTQKTAFHHCTLEEPPVPKPTLLPSTGCVQTAHSPDLTPSLPSPAHSHHIPTTLITHHMTSTMASVTPPNTTLSPPLLPQQGFVPSSLWLLPQGHILSPR